jgi:hypothetical protein
MAKSKYFRVATEGATTDGRVIDRAWIVGMGASYNPQVYGARIFAEHIRGIVPDSPLRAYGDVTALKAEEIAEGPLKGKMALYAQIQPSDAMVELIKSGQKIYTSVEIDTAFASTKTPYLVGLGITDSPASLGTEVLSFAAQHPDANPFAGRKKRKENLFSAAEESSIELEDDADPSAFAALRERLDKLLGKFKVGARAIDGDAAKAFADMTELVEHIAAAAETDGAKFAADIASLTARLTAAEAAHKETADAFAAFRAQLDSAPEPHTPRPPATGGNNIQQTNC